MLLPLAQFPVLLLVQHSPTLPSHTPIPNQTQRIPLLTYLLTIADKLTVFFDNAKEKIQCLKRDSSGLIQISVFLIMI